MKKEESINTFFLCSVGAEKKGDFVGFSCSQTSAKVDEYLMWLRIADIFIVLTRLTWFYYLQFSDNANAEGILRFVAKFFLYIVTASSVSASRSIQLRKSSNEQRERILTRFDLLGRSISFHIIFLTMVDLMEIYCCKYTGRECRKCYEFSPKPS